MISGLGIIGGSIAKALKKYTDHTVIGINRSSAPLEKALACGAIDAAGSREDLKTADMLILGMYPDAAVNFVRENASFINSKCIVTDTSGIKSEICPRMCDLAEKYGFTFVGFHPMAGKEKNGFDVSDADLFLGASSIIIPGNAPESAVNILADLTRKIGFGRVVFTTPEEHDRMIAFTSQLPHVLACAYVFSPQCPNHNGFSAGSYRDVSRVANINAELWSELFIENSEPLSAEIQTLIDNLTQIKAGIIKGDKKELAALLHRAKLIKEALGE